MRHKRRRLKKILSMILSLILVVGLAGGVMPIRAMAEEEVHTNMEELQPSENNGIPSGGDEMLPDSSGTQVGTGGVSGNELISNEEKDDEENGDEEGEEIISQDADEEYFQINFYSDGILQETCEVKAGEKLSQFPELVKEGYRLIGWAVAEENGEEFDLDAAITQTMDLYAKWEPANEEAVLFLADAAPVAAQETSYSTDGGSTWNEGTFAEAVDACRSAGQSSEISLQQDIILTGTNWDGNHYLAGDHDITVDGQGHRIIRGDADAGPVGRAHVMLSINGPCTVTLKNITIDGGAVWSSSDPTTRANSGITIAGEGPLVYVRSGGRLVLEAGAVLENNHLDGSGGAGVRLESNSSFIMKDGAEIRSNTAFASAAVALDNASFQMKGGSIHGNYAGSSYAVYVGEGNFIMEGGNIAGNGTAGGAAIQIGSGTKAGNVQIKGGSISNNIMTNADGHGNSIIDGQKGFLIMSGGEISGGSYGGVSISPNCTMEMSGGSIVNNTGAGINAWNEGGFKVSGNPVITGNTGRNGVTCNVDLSDGGKIILSGPLTQGASIGVVKGVFDKDGIFTSGWLDKMGEVANPADYFSSDTGKYIVVKDETTGEAKLVDHVHAYGTDWKWDDTDHWHECDCGAKADQAAHTEDGGTITKQPTETEAGEKVYKCTICGHERTEILSATGSGSGDDKDDSGDDKGDNGDNQGSNEGGPGNSAENQGSSDSAAGGGSGSAQMNENTQAGDTVAEVKAVNESAPASLQTSEENTVQKEAAGDGTEPKTGENMAVEVYATVAMIAGLMYLLSYFDSEKCGMTEAEKRELLTRIIKWSRKGGWFRIGLALAAIFLLLVYYHSIGKKTAGWKEVYGE